MQFLNDSTNSTFLLSTNENTTGCEDPLISDETFHIIRVSGGGCLTLLISVPGIGASVCNCLVFHRQGLSNRMNLCLFFLSAADFSFEVFGFLIGCVTVLTNANVSSDEHYVQTVASVLSIMCGLKVTSGCYYMVIAVERCLCVMFPLHASTLIKTRTTGIMLALIAAFAQFGFLPMLLKYQVQVRHYCGIYRWHFASSQLDLHYKEVIDTIVFKVMCMFVPAVNVVVVVVATVITVIKLRQCVKWRQHYYTNKA